MVREIVIKAEGTEVHITSKEITIRAEEIVWEGGSQDEQPIFNY